MNQRTMTAATRLLSGMPSRRDVLGALAAAGLGWGLSGPGGAAAREPRRGKKRKRGLCRPNGSPCARPGKRCKKRHCLRAPFTIEATWTQQADQEVYLFVPPRDGATGPGPHVYSFCNPGNSRCEEAYPFACVNVDSTTGPEITTIHRLLPGNYEFWVELFGGTPAGEVTVVLRDNGGRVARRWANPANPSPTKQAGWHVFDVDGRDGRVTPIDALIEPKIGLPDDAYTPHTLVCPYNA